MCIKFQFLKSGQLFFDNQIIRGWLTPVEDNRELKKLTRRPSGGGHIQISIQLRVINVRGRVEFTWL